MKKNNNNLKKAVLEYYDEKVQALEESLKDAPPHVFSDKFEEKMEEAFCKKRKEQQQHFLNRTTLKMILIALFFVSLFIMIKQKTHSH